VINETFSYTVAGNNFKLKPNAGLNAEWTFDSLNSIKAKVTQIHYKSLFYGYDSVKTIKLSSGDSILIAKRNGILRFPLNDSTARYFRLVGIQNLKLGVTMPDFYDIYNFDVGDVFQYLQRSQMITGYVDTQEVVTSKIRIVSKLFDGSCYVYNVQGVRNTFSYTSTNTVSGSSENSESFTDTISYCVSDFAFLSGEVNAIANVTTFLNEKPVIIYPNKQYGPDWRSEYAANLGAISSSDGHTYNSLVLTAFVKSGDTTGYMLADSIILKGGLSKTNQGYHINNPSITNNTIKENLPPGTFIGKFISDDPNKKAKLYYHLGTTCDRKFFFIRNDSLFSDVSFAFKNAPLYPIFVGVQDDDLGVPTGFSPRIAIVTDDNCEEPQISISDDGYAIGVFPNNSAIRMYSWYFDGLLIQSDFFNTCPSTVAYPSNGYANGTYTVTVTYFNGCTKTSKPFEVTPCMFINPEPAQPTITVNGEQLTASNGLAYTWHRDSVLLSQTAQTISATGSGSYTVEVSFGNGCSKISDPVVITEIKESAQHPITLYPNPTTGKFVLRSSTSEPLNVSLYNTTGQLLQSYLWNGNADLTIDIHNQPAGLYLVYTSNGNDHRAMRVVKQ
jgi:hypothetical protein